MPRLPTYTAKLEDGGVSGGRRATAEDAGAVDLTGAVRAVQNTAAGFLDTREEDETRKVLVKQAEIRAKYAKRLDEAVTSGEDVAKIRQELDNDLASVSEGLETRKGADSAALHAANTGAIFDNQANQIAVTRATLEARVAGGQFLNSTGAIIASNPLYLPQAERDVDAFVATLSKVPPEKRAAMAADLKQNMNVAAAMAQARLDPEGTMNAVKGGAFNMTPEQRAQVVSQAEATIRAKRVDENFKRAEEDRAKQDRSEAATDGYFKQIMRGGFSMQKVLEDPNLTPRAREHLALMAESRAKALANGDGKSDPAVKRELFLDITAPDGDPRKVYNADKIFQAAAGGRINTSDAAWLMGVVANQRDENNRGFGQRLNGRVQTVAAAMRSSPQYQAQPELAAAIQNEMITQVEKRAAEMRKENKSPDGLLDSTSKDYFFKPELIKTLADDVRRQQSLLSPAYQPGQTVVRDGATWVFKGGDPSRKESWAPSSQVAPAGRVSGTIRRPGVE